MCQKVNLIFFGHLIIIHGLLQGGSGVLGGSAGIIELIEKSVKEFRFDTDWDFPLNIETRGVSDLPNYYYRDDGLLLWKAIKEYVEDILDLFYLSDEDVLEDSEIQEWIDEIYRYNIV